MNTPGNTIPILTLLAAGCIPLAAISRAAERSVAAATKLPAQWRAEHRIIDLHQHLSCRPDHLARAVKIMDAVGIGIAVNLSGGRVTTTTQGEMSEFEQNKRITDQLYPGRFLHYMNLDYRDWNEPDFPARAVRQIEEGHRLGAAGLKEFKRLGLSLRDNKGTLIQIDDPRLDPVWKRCGELDLPVSIHVADPKAFWMPYDSTNERWKELKDHRSWWFGDPTIHPPRMDLLNALDRVIARHPATTFVCVHFANNAEELEWVDSALSRRRNMMADLAARIPELGRHPPDSVRELFLKHHDRILFGSDFQVRERLVLGSSGNEAPPTDADAEVFFEKEWRWLETLDRDWEHMTPIQGDWTISSIGLPPAILRNIYFDNAQKLLARSMPRPIVKAVRIQHDFPLTGDLKHVSWQDAQPISIERQSRDATARPEVATPVRALWSDNYLYLGYECPFVEVTAFNPPEPDRERIGLWERDVVEAFIGTDRENISRYTEYQVAPTNEKLDVAVDLPDKDFGWSSRFESAVWIDDERRIWRCEMRIPLAAFDTEKPSVGTKWRLNLYRVDRSQRALMAWHPTLRPTFHTPERFGTLVFTE